MRYSTSSNFLRLLLIHILAVAPLWLTAQENAHLLSVDELFRLGTENSLQLKKSKLQEVIYNDQKKSAYTDRLPDIQVGASAGIIGQPVIFQRGLSHPVRPETPDWSQNYNINLTQPLYQGGRIQAKIRPDQCRQRSRNQAGTAATVHDAFQLLQAAGSAGTQHRRVRTPTEKYPSDEKRRHSHPQ